jgi:hypothetical protein
MAKCQSLRWFPAQSLAARPPEGQAGVLKLRQMASSPARTQGKVATSPSGVVATLGTPTANPCTNSGQNPIESWNAQMGMYP